MHVYSSASAHVVSSVTRGRHSCGIDDTETTVRRGRATTTGRRTATVQQEVGGEPDRLCQIGDDDRHQVAACR